MSVNVYNKENDKLNLVSGGTLYADAPIGSIIPYGGTTAPSGWLVCQGQEVSRNTYAELFAVIGTTFGSGNGSTTFNVPKYTQLKQDYTVKTQLDTWRNSLEDGSESHSFTITEDGSYYFEVVLSNATEGKQSNNITLTEDNKLICSWGFVGANAILQNKTIFLKAGTYVFTHICATTGIGGTSVVTVYSTRNSPIGSYIIKAKQVSVPFDVAEYIRNQNVLSDYETASNSFTAEYDGFITAKATGTGAGVNIKINNVLITSNTNADYGVNGVSALFKKGDVIVTNDTAPEVCYYKLRDYTGR